MKLTKTIARKVLTTVDAGLCGGQGRPEPGHMCIEAAVCYALGLPHGDNPPCVGSAVRSFKIGLNDSNWSSYQARAKGMRKIAIAQLGSNEIDQQKFAELLALKTIQQLCPKLFRALAKAAKSDEDKAAIEEAAVTCETAKELKPAAEKLDLALALALALARARARARALAEVNYDEALTLLADICLECLIELKSPGCKWLPLCDESESA